MSTVYFPNLSVNRPSHLGGNKWELSGLNTITIIFGKNGNGKSALLRKIRDENSDYAHYASPERAGDINYDINQFQQQTSATANKNRSTNLASSYRQEAIARIHGLFTIMRGKSILRRIIFSK